MTVTLNGRAINVKRVSETIGASRRLSLYCDGEQNLEVLKADVDAHGAGNPITITRDDGSTMTYEKGYTRVDGIERTIATGEDDITRLDLNMTEKAADENIVIDPDEAPAPETAAE